MLPHLQCFQNRNRNKQSSINASLFFSTEPVYGSGTCMPIYGKKQGEGCFRDNDCESGFLCLKDGLSGEKSCQAPVPGTQGLGKSGP